jgi:hypothetical protein
VVEEVTLLAATLLVAAEAMEVALLVAMEMEVAQEKETPLMAVTLLITHDHTHLMEICVG